MNNLLKSALTLVGSQKIELLRFEGDQITESGLVENKYGEPEQISAQVQPMAAKQYDFYGINKQQRAVTVWAVDKISGLSTASAGDRLLINGKFYQVVGIRDWQAQNGWQKVDAVEFLSNDA